MIRRIFEAFLRPAYLQTPIDQLIITAVVLVIAGAGLGMYALYLRKQS